MKILAIVILSFSSIIYLNGDKSLGLVSVTSPNGTYHFYIDRTKPEEIIDHFGKTKLSSSLVRFAGHTHEPMFTREQELYYKNLGIRFTFRSKFNRPKKSAKIDSCSLAVVTIFQNSSCCVDGFCIDTPRQTIVDSLGAGINIGQVSHYVEPGFIMIYQTDESTKLRELQRFMSEQHHRTLIDAGKEN